MKRWQLLCIAVAIGLIAGVLTTARGAPPAANIAPSEVQMQQQQIAQAAAWPVSLLAACPLKVQATVVHGSCLAQYTIPAHSIALLIANGFAGIELPMGDSGTPIVVLQTGNIHVSGEVTYAQVWFIATDSIIATATLRNDTDDAQSGTAVVRMLIPRPETTTPAAVTAGAE